MPTPYSPAGGNVNPRLAHSRRKELVRNLNQDAGAVAGFRIAAARAAMRQVDEDLNALGDDVVRRFAVDVGDKADTAGVVLVTRIVQALLEQGGHYALRLGPLFPSGALEYGQYTIWITLRQSETTSLYFKEILTYTIQSDSGEPTPLS